MEAWLSNTPIIASDRDFARAILGTSAVFCEPHNVNNVYQTLVNFSQNQYDTKAMIEEGNKRLTQLPSIEKRWEMVKKIIFQENFNQ